MFPQDARASLPRTRRAQQLWHPSLEPAPTQPCPTRGLPVGQGWVLGVVPHATKLLPCMGTSPVKRDLQKEMQRVFPGASAGWAFYRWWWPLCQEILLFLPFPMLGDDDKHWGLPPFSCDPSRRWGGTYTREWVKGGQ